jgi:uncharacterized protein (DUF488 family)
MAGIRLFTIGFTKKSAEHFFTALSRAGVQRVLDIRLNNVSQLAGFAKRDDLRYFLKALCGIDYLHLTILAPGKELLDAYRKNGGDWPAYQRDYLRLIAEREVERRVSRELIDGGCLLCSEEAPNHCHRRLAAEYFAEKLGEIEIIHLP